jgi:hypothetical protein
MYLHATAARQNWSQPGVAFSNNGVKVGLSVAIQGLRLPAPVRDHPAIVGPNVWPQRSSAAVQEPASPRARAPNRLQCPRPRAGAGVLPGSLPLVGSTSRLVELDNTGSPSTSSDVTCGRGHPRRLTAGLCARSLRCSSAAPAVNLGRWGGSRSASCHGVGGDQTHLREGPARLTPAGARDRTSPK